MADVQAQDRQHSAMYPKCSGPPPNTTHVNWDRFNKLGTTTNSAEAGFIRPDGSWVDLSDKFGNGEPGCRAMCHSYAAGDAEGLNELIELGIIRYNPEHGELEIGKEPTGEQAEMIKRLVTRHTRGFTLDIRRPWKEENNTDKWRSSMEGYRKKLSGQVNPDLVLNIINQFYNGSTIESLNAHCESFMAS